MKLLSPKERSWFHWGNPSIYNPGQLIVWMNYCPESILCTVTEDAAWDSLHRTSCGGRNCSDSGEQRSYLYPSTGYQSSPKRNKTRRDRIQMNTKVPTKNTELIMTVYYSSKESLCLPISQAILPLEIPMKRLLYLLKHGKLTLKSTPCCIYCVYICCINYSKSGYTGTTMSFSLAATSTYTFSSETYFSAQLFSQKSLAY